MKKRETQLPEGWEVKKLGDICKIISGQSPQSKYYNSNGNGIPFYQGKKDYGVKYIGKPSKWTTKVTKLAEENDILISVRAPVGPINFSTQKICIGRGLAAIRSGQLIDKEYLFYFLKKHESEIESSSGAVFNSINRKQLERIELPLPTLPEQRRIASILDQAFATIDQAITNAGKNLQNAGELFESYLQGVFENRGEGWVELKLKEIGLTQTGNTPRTSEKENYGEYIPFIKPADVDYKGFGDLRYTNNGLSEIGFKKARLMKKGSILMVCIGATIGKVGFAERDVSSNQQINSLTVSDPYFPQFFYYAMKSKVFQKKVLSLGKGAQATLPIINKSKWENLTIPFPKSREKQEKYVEKFNALAIEIRRMQEVYSKKIAALEELKKSILQKAFAGELATEKVEMV